MMIDRKACLKMASSLIWLFVCSGSAYSQEFNEVIDRYTAQYPEERVYLHYDKSIYTAGETIWFKAYLRDGFEATNFSKSLYVDFSDENGKVLAHSLFPVGESSSRGQFSIPRDYNGTVIQVKAYTKWMLNFDTAFLYKKTIKVIPKGNSNIFVKPQKLNVNVTFFPEGGDLVNGVESKVAFLAVDQYGKPVDIAGKVTNNAGKKVADIVTKHNGMGTFTLTPTADERYKAEWTATEGNSGTYTLPTAMRQGLNLSVMAQPNGAAYKIARTAEADESLKKVSIVGMMYNRLVYMANLNLTEKNIVQGSIPFNELPAGILQLTIMDSNKKPVSERIVFVNAKEYAFPIEVGITKLGLGKRQENELSVHLPDNTTLANMSVSVTDAGINTDATENIYSNLLLTSQIKGRVYNPAYYFTEQNPAAAANLDLVMLTHGWRRYDWQKIAKQQPLEIKYAPDTSYLHFGGRVFATEQQISAGGDLVAILKVGGDTSQNGNFLVLPIKKDGTFEDRNISFMDSVSVYYSYSNKNSPLRYSEVRFLEDKVTTPMNIPIDRSDVLASKSVDSSGFGRDKYFSTLNFTAWEEGDLKDVVVTATAKSEIQKLDERYASGLFKGDAYQFDLINDRFASGSMNIFQYLQSRVPGLQISNVQSTEPSLSWRGSPPSLFLDEMPTEAAFLTNVNVNDIAYVKVFRPPFFGAMGGGSGGGIAVYTKRGGDVSTAQQSGRGIPFKVVEGYTVIKEFYSPNYITLDPRHENPDHRSTIYWNPFILLDKNGKTAKFRFYNNDVTSSFRIVLEGVNSEGKLVHIEKVVQ